MRIAIFAEGEQQWMALAEGILTDAGHRVTMANSRDDLVGFDGVLFTSRDFSATAENVKRERPAVIAVILTASKESVFNHRMDAVKWICKTENVSAALIQAFTI